MKFTEHKTPEQVRPDNTSHPSLYATLKHVGMTSLLLLSGDSNPEASHSIPQAPVPHTPTPQNGALVVPDTNSIQRAPKITMSEKLKRDQDRLNTRPSDISRLSAYSQLRSAIAGATGDTATVDVALSTLRPAYNPKPEAQAHRRQLVAVVAKHANISEQRFYEIVDANNTEYIKNLSLTSERSALHERLGLQKFKSDYGRRLIGIQENEETVRQLITDANLDKIDASIALLKELSTLFQAKERGAPYDAKRLKSLSRMCESNTLEEVNEKIPLLELIRKRNSDGMELPIRRARENITHLERENAESESRLHSSWCEDYDRMCAWLTRLQAVEESLAARSPARKQKERDDVGSIVDTNLHPQLRVDMAAINLRAEAVTEYILRNQEGDSVATVIDRGTIDFERTALINIAIDEPSTVLCVQSDGKTGMIRSRSGGPFDRRDLDLKETIRSELSEDFHPTFIENGKESSVPIKTEKALISVYMNPGCSLDLRDATTWNPEIRSAGGGSFIVGEPAKNGSYVKVKVVSTLANEAPLLVSMPESLTINDLQVEPDSGTGLTILAGNARFEINGPSQDGRGDNVDVEIKTPRGVQHVPVVRNGRCVYGRNNQP